LYYWDYIKVEDLLALQGGADSEESKLSNDEVLFIVVHQVYELWFKLVLRELVAARDLFRQNPVPDMAMASAVRSFKRVSTIFRQAASHFEVVETLTTRDYLAFRDALIPASGFQSAQIREIEIILGLEEAQRVQLGAEGSYKEALRMRDGSGSPALARVEARIADKPSLRDVVYAWLVRTPVSAEGPGKFIDGVLAAHRSEVENRIRIAEASMRPTPEEIALLRERYGREVAFAEAFLKAEDDPSISAEKRADRQKLRAALMFLESHRELPRLAWPREVIDALIEMEQSMIIWRQRHARMVERVIGRRIGTGGSSGVDYLDQTANRYRIFGDVWAVRTLLLRKAAVPAIDNADDFRFRVED
jgi:tryptophan 2,3-dioxygenase